MPRKYNGGCGIGCHDKMSRGTEDRERKGWQQHRVKSGNHGHARNPCVAEYLGDIHRCKGQAREYVAQHRLRIEGP